MPDHIHEDHIGAGLSFSGGVLSATGSGPIFAGRYLNNTSDTDGAASFIDADVNTNGAWTLSLRDADHAAGMHYWIRVDVGTNTLTIQRASGSTKVINGNFVGQQFINVTSFGLLRDDGIVRLKPDGANWVIY